MSIPSPVPSQPRTPRRGPSHSARPYTHFQRAGLRRFGGGASLFQRFRVHG